MGVLCICLFQCLFVCFGDRIVHSLGWHQMHYIGKDDLKSCLYLQESAGGPGVLLLLGFMLAVLRMEPRVPCTQGKLSTHQPASPAPAFRGICSCQVPGPEASNRKHWAPCLSLDPSPQWQLMGCHGCGASPCLVGQEMSVSGMQGGTGVR